MSIPSTLQAALEFLTPRIKSWNFKARPLVLGISGPQGSGKTYLSSQLSTQLSRSYPDLLTIVISIDDLYLTHDEQVKLNNSTSNPLLKGRGLPGTHDVHTLYTKLSKLINKDDGFSIPTYDKSAFGGEGDRNPEDQWIKVPEGRSADIVILEGWFIGFQPIEDGATFEKTLEESELLQKYGKDDLNAINYALDEYFKIWNLIDYGILFATDDIKNVYKWRIEQEHDLISKKGEGMTDDQVRTFVERYMTVYELYYKDFVANGFRKTKEDGNLKIEIDSDRNVINSEVIDTKIAYTHHSIY